MLVKWWNPPLTPDSRSQCPIGPLDLLNDVKPRLWSVRVAFFRGPNCELIELLEDETGYA